MLGDKTLEAIEVTILGQESGNAVLAAQRHDLGIEDKVADGIRLTNRFPKERRVGRAWDNHGHTRRGKQPCQRLARLVRGVWWIEQPWMGYDTNEFPDAEHGNRPTGGRLRECDNASESRTVLR